MRESTLRRLSAVAVQQTTHQGTTLDWIRVVRQRCVDRGALVEPLVRTSLIVDGNADSEHAAQMGLAADQ